jgi:hypothetical protein
LGARGYQALYLGQSIRAASGAPLDELYQHCERLDATPGDLIPPVVAFPTPAYDPELDRFELTAKGEAYLNGAAGQPLA